MRKIKWENKVPNKMLKSVDLNSVSEDWFNLIFKETSESDKNIISSLGGTGIVEAVAKVAKNSPSSKYAKVADTANIVRNAGKTTTSKTATTAILAQRAKSGDASAFDRIISTQAELETFIIESRSDSSSPLRVALLSGNYSLSVTQVAAYATTFNYIINLASYSEFVGIGNPIITITDDLNMNLPTFLFKMNEGSVVSGLTIRVYMTHTMKLSVKKLVIFQGGTNVDIINSTRIDNTYIEVVENPYGFGVVDGFRALTEIKNSGFELVASDKDLNISGVACTNCYGVKNFYLKIGAKWHIGSFNFFQLFKSAINIIIESWNEEGAYLVAGGENIVNFFEKKMVDYLSAGILTQCSSINNTYIYGNIQSSEGLNNVSTSGEISGTGINTLYIDMQTNRRRT